MAEWIGKDRYYALRGLVRHVLHARNTAYTGRNPTYGIAHSKPFGTCVWCGLPARNPATNRPLKWHPRCMVWQQAGNGGHQYAKIMSESKTKGQGYYWSDPAKRICLCGRPGIEVDHIVAIGVAARLAPLIGRKIWAMTFTPDNLQWLCHDCHSQKTAFDRAWMRVLDKPPEDETQGDKSRRMAAGQLRMDVGSEKGYQK